MDLLIDVRVARRDSTTSSETAWSPQDRTVRLRADHTGTVTDLITALLGGLDPAEQGGDEVGDGAGVVGPEADRPVRQFEQR